MKLFGFPVRFLGIPLGWRDRGYGVYISEKSGAKPFSQVHKPCGMYIRVGVEKGVMFNYCSFCNRKLGNTKTMV